MKRQSRLQKLARLADQQQRALARTEMQIAAASRPGDGAYIMESQWRWAEKLLRKRSSTFLKVSGALGYGLGRRRRGGVNTNEPCITVYVKEKLAREELRERGLKALPKYLSSGRRRIRVDVVQLGELRRYFGPGDTVSLDGSSEHGTLGALATDDFTLRQVAITAMHITELGEIPQPGFPRVSVVVPGFGRGNSTRYGDIIAGTMRGIDACKIDIDLQSGLENRIPFIGQVRGWRPIRTPGDRDTAVRMFGARSGLQSGVIETPLIALPQFDLNAAILVNMFAQHGDSGAALVDEQNLVLGFLVGQAGAHQVFCAAGEAFRILHCDIPTI